MEFQGKYESLKTLISEEIPGFEVCYKDEEWTQKAIGRMMFFNTSYMTRFTTTLYPKIYYPTRAYETLYPAARFSTLAHEYVHLCDQHHARIAFPLGYASPQIWGLLSLLSVASVWSLWFLIFLVFLVFFLPMPSPWRAQHELRGYSMNMFIEYHLNGSISDLTKMRTITQFTSWNYYRMKPGIPSVHREVTMLCNSIESGEITEGIKGKPFREILEILGTE